MKRYDFASDNTSGIAPEAIDALWAANAGFSAAYGEDPYTRKAADLLRGLIDADAEVYFTTTGTAANGVSLSSICRSFECVLTHQDAHTLTDETGAPSFFGHGLKVLGLPAPSGRIDPSALRGAVRAPRSIHRQSPAALSLTNATEYGAVYSSEALAELTQIAKSAGLATYLDGSRLANAAAAGFDLKSLKRIGIDLLLFGGTKMGMPMTEALLILDPRLSCDFAMRLKQAGQLVANSRFLAAPWIGLLESGAWLTRARHANAMARKLAAGLPFELAHPVEANGVFVHMSLPDLQRLLDAGWIVFRMPDDTVRFMCSWATTEEQVDELLGATCA